VPVGVLAGNATEEGAGPDLAAVEVDGQDLGRSRVAAHTDHVDVADQRGELHERGVVGVRRRQGPGRCRPGTTYGPSVTAPAGTAMEPVEPMAELEAEAVAVAVVGMP
jgi:hypothetical protein